jgi:hypothetical protein
MQLRMKHNKNSHNTKQLCVYVYITVKSQKRSYVYVSSFLYCAVYFVYFVSEKDRQCTYKDKLRLICETIFAVEKQKELQISVSECTWVRACGLAYPPCNAHAPYFIVIYGVSGSILFVDIIS